MKLRLLLTLYLLAGCTNASGQTDSILCFPVSEARELLIGYEQNKYCDSINTIQGHQLNEMDRQNHLLKEYIVRDSIQLIQKDEIIDMADRETRKQKRQKVLFGGLGLIGIILLILL